MAISDDRLDTSLRHFLWAEADIVAAHLAPPRKVLDTGTEVVADAEDVPHSLRLWALGAALVAAAVAAAFAFGAGLVRAPWSVDVPALVGSECPAPRIAPGVVVDYGRSSFRSTLYADGRLIEGPSAPGLNAPLSQRFLSPHGVTLLQEEVTRSGLATACNHTWSTTARADGFVAVRTGAGPVGVRWTSGAPGVRATGTATREAVNRLAERLENMARWLPASAWLDAEPEEVRAERWLLRVSPGTRPAWSASDPAAELPAAVALAMSETSRECVELSRAGASDLEQQLTSGGARTTGEMRWELQDATGAPWEVTVSAVRPAMDGCDGGEPETAGKAPEASEGLPPGVHACDILPMEAVAAVFRDGVEARSEIGGLSGLADGGGCRFTATSGAAVDVYRRAFATNEATATSLVAAVFGDGVQATMVPVGDAWLNACATRACESAIAVSAPPYFVVLVAYPHGETGPAGGRRESIRDRALVALAARLRLPGT